MKTDETFRRLVAAIALFRTLHEEAQAQTLLTFCAVASRTGPIPMQDVQASTGQTGSSTSRNVALLGPQGLDLLDAYEDPSNRRRKLLMLTPHGRRIARQIHEAMTKGATP